MGLEILSALLSKKYGINPCMRFKLANDCDALSEAT
jgi:hypothetical protein